MGVSGDDGGLVREEQTEDLVSDFSRELEEEEGHWWARCRWENSRWEAAVQLIKR